MNKSTLRKLIIQECSCMAREAEIPAAMSAAMPMLSILGYGVADEGMGDMDEMDDLDVMVDMDDSEDLDDEMRFEDSDDYEESGMIKNNLHNMAMHAKALHDAIQDGDDLPEWVQEKIAVANSMMTTIYDYLNAEAAHMHEAKKPWYMKKRRNMKKTNESEWYDIKPSKRPKKKIGESKGPGTVKPPQATKSKTVLPSYEDEGRSFAGVSAADDKAEDGKPLKNLKMRDFDIYADHK
jgi:hypothetical protein